MRGNRYQGLTLRFAVNVGFSFLNKLLGLKIDDKCNNLVLLFGLKIGILGFVAKRTLICSENREGCRFAGCDDGNISAGAIHTLSCRRSKSGVFDVNVRC